MHILHRPPCNFTHPPTHNTSTTHLHHLLQDRSGNVGQADDVLLGLAHAGREHGGHGGAGGDGDGALAVHLGARGGDELDVLGRVVVHDGRARLIEAGVTAGKARGQGRMSARSPKLSCGALRQALYNEKRKKRKSMAFFLVTTALAYVLLFAH